jgi:CO/xanthine dehydrogenase FAD-binding subunit
MALNTRWIRPESVAEACEALAQAPGRARAVAGCTGTPPLALADDPQAEVAVDLLAIEELRGIEPEGEQLRIGAATPLRELGEAEQAPLLARCARGIGDEVLRRHATLGGNLAMRGDAAHELASAVVALGGTVEVARGGERELLDAERLCDPALRFGSTDLIVAIRVPLAPGDSGYDKLTTNAGSYGVGSVAAHRPAGGDARVVVNPGSGIPARLPEVERTLADRGSGEQLRDAAARALASVATADDPLGSARYRRQALICTVSEAVEDMERTAR